MASTTTTTGSESPSDGEDFLFRITYGKDAPVHVEVGDDLSKYPSETQADVIGRILLTLGQRFIGASFEPEDDDYEDYDEHDPSL